MKKLLCLTLSLILITSTLIFTSCERQTPLFSEIDFSTVTDMSKVTTTDKKTDYVLLDIADYGQVLIRLYPDVAPKTVKNFKKLVSEGFYDGLTFHRVIENFMIQGGDPKGNGTGGSDKEIKGEFNANGFRNNLSHVRGVVSMARGGYDMDSASSQFFICHVDYPSLNGNYASFGFVVNGMDVVDKIAAVSTSSSDKPLTDVIITSAKFAVVPDEVLSSTPEAGAPDKDDEIKLEDSEFDYSEILNANLITESESPTDYVCMDIKDYGEIYVRLFPETAPITVANFKKLVKDGFYDGLTFHRAINKCMIQGGDPKGDGTGGSADSIKGEFLSNGVENNLKHTRGVISMARLDDNDSATSQFFISQTANSSYDGKYAAFGYVISGMDIVDSIAALPRDQLDNLLKKVTIDSIYFVNIPDTALEKGIESIENVSISSTPTNYALFDIENYGKVVVRLYPDVAPQTVANFQKLVSEGFYDGLTFHRIIQNFMIQGGDPEGTGKGSAEETIFGEFDANGFENNLSHVSGVISMARLATDYDSASCQFFICHVDYPSLDGNYAAFGYVIYGLDVIDKIAKAETNSNNNPIDPVVITSIKFVNIQE